MAKRVTIIDLAKAADVSVSTIDRILNKRGTVQRATAEHVLAVAQQIGFPGLTNLRRRLAEEAPERTFGFLLNRRERLLYGSFARALASATTTSTRIRGKAVVRHLNDLSPDATAAALRALGEQCDSIAGVCIDHPCVNDAIEDLNRRGIPFWSMLSDVSAPHRAGYVGTNGWKLGRSAGWFMARICPRGSTIAVFIGSELYAGHREFEAGFRSYMLETGIDFNLLSTAQTHENDQRAYELTLRLFDHVPAISAVLMAGGGIDGIVKACKERPGTKLAVVSTEISEMTPGHLMEGLVDVALSHEFGQVAHKVVRAMEARARTTSLGNPVILDVPMRVAIKENL